MYIDLWKQCWNGKSIYRSLHNCSIKGIDLLGRTIDLGSKNGQCSYYKFIKVNKVTYVDFFEEDENVVRLDLEKELPLENDSYDNVIMFNILEHIHNYELLLSESARILKKRGILHGVVPFLFPYHGDPYDYFRYTHQTIELILSRAGYDCIEINKIGVGSFTCGVHLCAWPLKFKPLIYFSWVLALNIDKLLCRLTTRNKRYYIGISFSAKKI